MFDDHCNSSPRASTSPGGQFHAAKQEVEVLEDAVELFTALLTEIGHRLAAELEALGRILGRPAGRLHDAIHGNLGADDDFPHATALGLQGRLELLYVRVKERYVVKRLLRNRFRHGLRLFCCLTKDNDTCVVVLSAHHPWLS